MTSRPLKTFAKKLRSSGKKKQEGFAKKLLPWLLLCGILWCLFFFTNADPQDTTLPTSTDTVSQPVIILENEPKEVEIVKKGVIDFPPLPFYVQAPLGQWQNPVFQNACEEASMLMVADALVGKIRSPEETGEELRKIARWQEEVFGTSVDTDVGAVARTLKEYFKLSTVGIEYSVDAEKLRSLLDEKKVALLPLNGQKLGNPYFTNPGPKTHMVVLVGHNTETKTFVTQDPGTRHGKNYEYDQDILTGALGDYPTGNHVLYQEPLQKNVVVLWNEADPLQN
jgi:hypothetical protein